MTTIKYVTNVTVHHRRRFRDATPCFALRFMLQRSFSSWNTSRIVQFIVNNAVGQGARVWAQRVPIITAERSGCTNVMAGQFIALIWVRHRDFVTCCKTTLSGSHVLFS